MSNALNKSLTSNWGAATKRSRLNLNSPVTELPPSVSGGDASAASSSTAGPSNESSPAGTTKRRPRPAGSSAPSSSSKRPKPSAPASSGSREPPTARLSSIGGLQSTIEKLLELVALPLLHPELYLSTGVQPPRGVLLHGPPGCGKTMMANALAGELNMPFISISAPSVVSGMSGESEKTLRETFEEAARIAPCLLFIDEIDAITPKRETAQREMERRIVAQLLTCMDDLAWDKNDGKPVIVIGATNRPDSLDPALRRAGRFDCEIAMGVPDQAGREEILRVLCSNLQLSGDFDFKALAKATPGYVGADLASLAGAAGVIAVKRMFKDLGKQGGGPGAALLAKVALDRSRVSTAPSSIDGDADASMAVDDSPETATVPATVPCASGNAGSTSSQLPLYAFDPPLDPSTSASASPSLPSNRELSRLSISDSTPATPTDSLFSSLPPSLLRTPIANFLLNHPLPLPSWLLATLAIQPSDFSSALLTVQPSSKREGFATVPDVTWSDIGALHETRDELHMAIVQPIRRPELFKRVGITAPGGVLLWGPPGCGKTLLAKAVANESRANFISVKGPELLNKYVGESERAVRQVFARARSSAPCIIFFDELDALVPRRDDSMSESSARVVNTLLTELDGLESRKGIYVIGATNRPDMIDPAMVRPGRLDKLLYVDLPSPAERAEILRTMTSKTPLSEDAKASLEQLAASSGCDGFSGADLAALTREAATLALRGKLESVGAFEVDDGVLDFAAGGERAGTDEEDESEVILVRAEHFRRAAEKVSPSVSVAQRKKYAALRNKFAGLPTKGGRRDGVLGEDAGELAEVDAASVGKESTSAPVEA